MKSPEEVIRMVKNCDTKQLHELHERCIEKQKNGFSLYREMIKLTIDHEIAEREGKSTTHIDSTVVEITNKDSLTVM